MIQLFLLLAATVVNAVNWDYDHNDGVMQL
jgi:hypothetical protein